MRKRTFVGLLLGFALPIAGALPAEATACSRAAGGPPVSVVEQVRGSGNVVVRELVACEHRRGRRFVLSRARLNEELPQRPARGRFIGRWSVAGRRVVWTEGRVDAGRVVAQLRLVAIGRQVRALRRTRIYSARLGTVPELDVALTTRGELFCLTPRGVFTERPSASRRRLKVGRDVIALDLEDDSTLRLTTSGLGIRYIELRARPRRGGCPVRSAFRPVHSTAEVLVSEAVYADEEEYFYTTVLRACLRSSGRDPVITNADEISNDGRSLKVLSVVGSWLAVLDVQSGRDGCFADVRAIQAGTGRAGRHLELPECDRSVMPSESAPPTVTASGVPAWVATTQSASRVVAPTSTGRASILDEGLPGSISTLVADDNLLRWLNDGEPRSAPA